MLSNKAVLKDRFDATIKSLEARLATFKADAREGASKEATRINNYLGELRESIASGWDKLTEEAATRINSLLSRGDDSEKASRDFN